MEAGSSSLEEAWSALASKLSTNPGTTEMKKKKKRQEKKKEKKPKKTNQIKKITKNKTKKESRQH